MRMRLVVVVKVVAMLAVVRRASHPPGRPTRHARVRPWPHRRRPPRWRKRQPWAFVLGEREARRLVFLEPSPAAATTTLLTHPIVIPVPINSLPAPTVPCPYSPLHVRFSAATHIPREIPVSGPPARRQVRALLRRSIVHGREQLRFPNPGPHLARQGAVRVYRGKRHPEHRGKRSGRVSERVHRQVRPRPVRIRR